MATEKYIFTFLVDHKKDSDQVVLDLIKSKFSVQATEGDIRTLRRRFQNRYNTTYRKQKSWKANAELASDTCVLESVDAEYKLAKTVHADLLPNILPENQLDDSHQETPSKVRRKSFQYCEDRQQKRRTQHLNDAINQFIETDCDGDLSVNQVLGYLLEKENRQTNKVHAHISS